MSKQYFLFTAWITKKLLIKRTVRDQSRRKIICFVGFLGTVRKKKTYVKCFGVLRIILLQHGNFKPYHIHWKFWTENLVSLECNFPEAAKSEAWEENLVDSFEFVAGKWAQLPLYKGTEAPVTVPVGHRPSYRGGNGFAGNDLIYSL